MNTRLTRLITCCLLGSGVVCGQDAATLLERMQSALGGPRLLQLRDIDWTVKAKVWDGAGHEAGFATRRQRVILPDQSRKDQEMHVTKDKLLHTRYYFDGKSGWGSFADMVKLRDTPVASLEGSELDMVRKEVRGFWLNVWRAQDYEVSLSFPHTLRFADKSDANNNTQLELDTETWLPGGGIKEWMIVDGIKVPKHILNYHAGHLVADIETVSVHVNTGLKTADLAHYPDQE